MFEVRHIQKLRINRTNKRNHTFARDEINIL